MEEELYINEEGFQLKGVEMKNSFKNDIRILCLLGKNIYPIYIPFIWHL